MNKTHLDNLMEVVKEIENMIEAHNSDQARESENGIIKYFSELTPKDQGSLITTLVLLIATLAAAEEKGDKPGTYRAAVLTARRMQETLDQAWKGMEFDMIKSGVICMTHPILEFDPMRHMDCAGNA